MKHTITTTAEQEAGLASLAAKHNASASTALTNVEYLDLFVGNILNQEAAILSDAEIQDVAAKFKAANKTKRDQVKTLLA